ncbi:MAG: hypothetical protein CMJ84_01055 [Planctomycetes bacterium]|nr:hypothetical protein [Planctomycetota bacterium]MDP6408337.1 hypothetical protein [Planctomycetota bacterium]
MDLNDYWQENKRFVMTVAGGALLFLIGELLIGKYIGGELTKQRASVARLTSDIAKPRFGRSDLGLARDENEALSTATETLAERVGFVPRPGFTLDPARGSVGNQYFARVSVVRDRLLSEAGRHNMRLQKDLGLPALAPTRPEEIERYLEALDLLERVVDIGLEVGVPRIDKIEIRLDPGLNARKGFGKLERTRVAMRLTGPSAALVRLLAETQSPARGASLSIDDLAMAPEKLKAGEAWMEITFTVIRLHGVGAEREEEAA